jgi:hypothetical protein
MFLCWLWYCIASDNLKLYLQTSHFVLVFKVILSPHKLKLYAASFLNTNMFFMVKHEDNFLSTNHSELDLEIEIAILKLVVETLIVFM